MNRYLTKVGVIDGLLEDARAGMGGALVVRGEAGVVDDAQWVDQPSADALVFTARRLRADRIAILFGAREGEVSRFEAAGLSEVALTGLSRQSADAVLAASVRKVVPGVRDRLLAEADGNPWHCLSYRKACQQSNCKAWSRCLMRCRSPRVWRACSGSESGSSPARHRQCC